jgi:hypothetical protein
MDLSRLNADLSDSRWRGVDEYTTRLATATGVRAFVTAVLPTHREAVTRATSRTVAGAAAQTLLGRRVRGTTSAETPSAVDPAIYATIADRLPDSPS